MCSILETLKLLSSNINNVVLNNVNYLILLLLINDCHF